MALGNYLVRTQTGGYVATGVLQDTDAYRPYLLETDSLGRLRRQVLLPPPLVGATENLQISRLWNNTLAVRDGSGYVFSGYATLGASGPYQAFVAKVDTALRLSWVAPLPAQRRPWLVPISVREQPDGTLLVAAADAPTAAGGRTPWLYVYTLSPGGQLLRRREAQATGYDWIWPYDWHPLAGDSALVVSGSARQAGPGGKQVAWVARFQPTLRPLSSAAPRGPVAPLAVYPNPTAGPAARVALPAGLPPGATLTLLDGLGRTLLRQPVPAAAPPEGVALPLGGRAPGLYVVQLTAPDGRRWSARLLRQ